MTVYGQTKHTWFGDAIHNLNWSTGVQYVLSCLKVIFVYTFDLDTVLSILPLTL